MLNELVKRGQSTVYAFSSLAHDFLFLPCFPNIIGQRIHMGKIYILFWSGFLSWVCYFVHFQIWGLECRGKFFQISVKLSWILPVLLPSSIHVNFYSRSVSNTPLKPVSQEKIHFKEFNFVHRMTWQGSTFNFWISKKICFSNFNVFS